MTGPEPDERGPSLLPDERGPSLLPAGWARVLLVLVAVVLLLGYLQGLRATPPDFDRPGPSYIITPAPPAPVAD